jgi:lysozyme family protein
VKSTYEPFVSRMINHYEGGYCWDSGDPGGPTKYGVTCFDLAAHRSQKMTSMSKWAPIVRAMSLTEAEEIYRTRYAAPMRYDELPAGADAVVMDYGVNSGIGRAIPVAARITGAKTSATRMSDELVAAINKMDPDKFIDAMNRERLAFLHGLAMWRKFGGGWGSRVADLTTYCHHIAHESHVTAPAAVDLSKVATPKTHAPTVDSKGTIGGVTGAIVTAGTAAATAHHFAVSSEILIGLAAIGVVGGIMWFAVRNAREAGSAS